MMAAVGATVAVTAATEGVMEEAGSSAVNKTRRQSNCPVMKIKETHLAPFPYEPRRRRRLVYDRRWTARWRRRLDPCRGNP